MAGFLPGESSHNGMLKNNSHDKLDEPNLSGSRWYFLRKEIEENSPSRRDGIDLKKETYLQKSYCTFLQDLGMRLKVPQVTIATAIVFCHRFFLRQSHAKNDRRTIATVCMFLAGKVEETPRPLKDVILVSYEIIHKKDPSASQRIKQKEVYEEQKELILIGERLVLATLGFDMNVHHPYKPLVEAIKKFKVAQNALAQVAWNFVNDGLRTSLCLQYKPHHISAGAIFLAAKFLKVKLPSDGEKVWWQEFDVTPRQLEDVSNQMLELYEQNRTGQTFHAGEVEASNGIVSHQPVVTTSTVTENSSAQKQSDENKGTDNGTGLWDRHIDHRSNESLPPEMDGNSNIREISSQTSSYVKSTSAIPSRDAVVNETYKLIGGHEWKDEAYSSKPCGSGSHVPNYCEGQKGLPPSDAVTRINKDKVKAALEKRWRLRDEGTRRDDIMDEDDLIGRELENGIELSVEEENVEKMKQERRQSWPKPLNRYGPDNQRIEQAVSKTTINIKGLNQQQSNGRTKFIDSGDRILKESGHEPDFGNAEEGELSSVDEKEFASPNCNSISGKAASNGWSSEECVTTRPDSLKRNRNDYEYPPKLVSERAMGTGGRSDGTQQHDKLHPSYGATGTGWSDFPQRDHKRKRYDETHG